MMGRALILGLGTAGLLLPFASIVSAIEAGEQAPLVQVGPRIIQVPEAANREPKRRAPVPPKRPEAAKPPLAQTPPTPSLRAPAQTKPNRKIWI